MSKELFFSEKLLAITKANNKNNNTCYFYSMLAILQYEINRACNNYNRQLVDRLYNIIIHDNSHSGVTINDFLKYLSKIYSSATIDSVIDDVTYNAARYQNIRLHLPTTLSQLKHIKFYHNI